MQRFVKATENHYGWPDRRWKDLQNSQMFVTPQTGCHKRKSIKSIKKKRKSWTHYSACVDKHSFSWLCLPLKGESLKDLAEARSARVYKVNQNGFIFVKK